MKRSKFSPKKVLNILDEFRNGLSMEALCCEYKISQSLVYNWLRKYGGLEAIEPKHLIAQEKDILGQGGFMEMFARMYNVKNGIE